MTAAPDVLADPAPEGRFRAAMGPLTAGRVVALVVALAFLAGAVGFVVGERRGARDPLSATDVGFMQDMSRHHEQAIEMSLLLLGKPGIDPDLRSFAQEIVMDQRYEIGVMNATLDRFGHPVDTGSQAMDWMGPTVPTDKMPGLASAAQIDELTKATGPRAEALWIALMARHHLGGIHMADDEARHGHDRTVRNLALGMVKTQRGEIVDQDSARQRLGLPIPKGFTDPTKDPGLRPLSLTGS